jgi:hypothetical protein
MSDDRFPYHNFPDNWQDRLEPTYPSLRPWRENESWAFLILVVSVLAMVVCLIVSPTL